MFFITSHKLQASLAREECRQTLNSCNLDKQQVEKLIGSGIVRCVNVEENPSRLIHIDTISKCITQYDSMTMPMRG